MTSSPARQPPPNGPDRPLVSIGVPAYNGGRYLAEALESALAQEYAPLEVIVSDDASTDDTEAIGRRFVAADPRVRYVRNDTNIGAVENFRRVLTEARGEYFTWLGHDDVLSTPHYVGTVVDYLECNPDVVGCASDLYVLDYESPGSVTTREYPEIHPDRRWAEAREEFFRWPQRPISHAIYGMFRRKQLVQVPMVTRKYRGRPSSAWWEMPVLAPLTGRGRIVALPEPLRAFRAVHLSDGWRTYGMASQLDLLVLGVRMKLVLLRIAWQVPLPLRERLPLLRIALMNFCRGNFRRPTDTRVIIEARAQEYAVLQQVADERAQLIRALRAEVAKRREHVRALYGAGSGECDRGVTTADGVEPSRAEPNPADLRVAHDLRRFQRSRTSPRLVLDFFRAPPDWQLELCRDLNGAIGRLRRQCDEHLRTIERLHAEAETLLKTIDSPAR